MLLLRICSDDLIACDMYLTLNNAFYEAYVVWLVLFLFMVE